MAVTGNYMSQERGLDGWFDIPQTSTCGREEDAWLGGDVATSFQVQGGHLWVFGDTFVGQMKDGGRDKESSFIRQSFAWEREDGGGLDFVWATDENGRPATSVVPSNGKREGFFWLMQGCGVGEETLMLGSRVVENGANAFGFQVKATCVVVVENVRDPPEVWAYRETDLPFPGSWTCGLALGQGEGGGEEGMMYVLGLCEKTQGYMVLRARAEDWMAFRFDETEFWCEGGEWGRDVEKAIPLFGEGMGGTESSLAYVRGVGWLSVSIPPFTDEIHLFQSDTLVEGWSSRVVSRIPPSPVPSTFFYAPKLHPQIAAWNAEDDSKKGGGVITITYNSNVMSGDALFEPEGTTIYVPKAVTVPTVSSTATT